MADPNAPLISDRQWIHRIALSMLKGIGPVNARNLVAYCGGVDNLFTDRAVRRSLKKVPGIGPKLAASILDTKVLEAAERELAYARRQGLRILFYLDRDYPRRLVQCPDAPVLLYVKGNAHLDPLRSVAIVGTRRPTDHGKLLCDELVAGLAASGVTVVSGLAYGIDIIAHRTALRVGLPTIGCVAHGMERLYPGQHAATAKEMCARGGLVTELHSDAPFMPGNFPARNRVIAGLSDCTIVVESGAKGGSLITADIANSYDRDVMAFPGRPTDERSTGCNRLIQQDKAHLVNGPEDVLRLMEWRDRPKPAVQPTLFTELTPDEEALVEQIRTQGRIDIDTLCHRSRIPQHKAASLLLNLEFNGVVRSLPGKMYALN